MKPAAAPAKLLGFVQVRVGARTYAVPVQALGYGAGGPLRDGAGGPLRDGAAPAGGFFAEGEQLGIFVDESAPDVPAQIRRATEDAVRHLSVKTLN